MKIELKMNSGHRLENRSRFSLRVIQILGLTLALILVNKSLAESPNPEVLATAPVITAGPDNAQTHDPNSVGGQKFAEDSHRVFTIIDAVKYTLENNATLKQYREILNQDEQAYGVARANVLPTLTYTFKDGSATSPTLAGNTVIFGGNVYNTYSGDLNFTQPLFVYGSLAALRSVGMNSSLAKVNVELQERTLTSQVISAFYSIILSKKLLMFLEEQKPVVQKSVETTQERYRIGRSQLLDVLQAQTQLALLQPQIETARGQFASSGAQLASVLGMTNVSQISVKGRLRTVLLKDVKPLLQDPKQVYFPELEQNRLLRAQIKESKSAQMGKYWPTLYLYANYLQNAYAQSDIFNPAASSWNAYIYLSIPIFQGFASKYDSANYLSQELQLEHAQHQLDITINTNQITDKTAVESAEASLTSAIEADNLAQASLKEAIRQYKLATIDFLQFLTIEQSALTSRSSVEQLRYNSLVAYTSYFVALGQPLKNWIEVLNAGVNP